jgi:GT2 family glycosyltransferase
MAQGHDAYLWLNDDTLLAADAIKRLLQCQAQVGREDGNAACIVVGATCDAKTGLLTYGGLYDRGRRWNRHFAKLPVANIAQPCLSFNGNCVLVQAAAAKKLGNLDPQYVHGIGDWDYGLRATAAGVQVWMAPGFVGTCSHNDLPGSNAADARGAASRLQHVCSPKQLPPRAWRVYVRRHFPVLWPVYFARPYLGALTRDLGDRLRHLFPVGRP